MSIGVSIPGVGETSVVRQNTAIRQIAERISTNYAPLASPAFTGDPTAPTADLADNDTSLATTAFVKGQNYVQSITLSGDASGSATVTSFAAALPVTIGAGVVTYAKMASAAIASANEYRAATASKLLAADNVWSAAAFVTLTDAATVDVDFSTGFNFELTLGGNRTLGNPTNAKPGQSGVIRIVQDGTGSRTLSYDTNWLFPNGVAPTLSTAAGASDMLSYVCITSSVMYAVLNKNFS